MCVVGTLLLDAALAGQLYVKGACLGFPEPNKNAARGQDLVSPLNPSTSTCALGFLT